MSERDELADLIAFETADAASGDLIRCSADGETPVFKVDERLADAILAAGYRKPRVITTTEELDALAPESIIKNHDIIVKVDTDEYHFMDGDGWGEGRHVSLPATVLWEPK